MASEPVNQLAPGVTADLYKAAMGARGQADALRHGRKMCGWALVHGAALLGLLALQPAAAADGAVKPEPKSGSPRAPAATVPAGKTTEKAPKAKPKAKADDAKRQWFVQAGAFANEANAKNVQTKVEATGLQATAEASDTKAGRLTRVRAGPFDSKADAEKAALRIKALDLPAVLVRQ